MSLILSIETATAVCSVALHHNGQLIGTQTLYIEKSHSGLLAPVIDSLVKYCGFTLNDLSAVAVSEGPGSYTGLRIGVSTAKGLCFALDIPLVAVNTLEAMAFGVNKYNRSEALLCPMIDARRMEVYCLIATHNMEIVEHTKPEIIDTTSFENFLLKSKVLFFGNGAAKCEEVITSENALFIDNVYPDASNVGFIAYRKYQEQKFEDVAYFEPFYLKEFRITKPKAK
ncbi:tRNA (adenosine(37)-N6)-threonylcarbamoyltransferase complex dimerization subunit type 1 TsaB [Fulvivirga sp. 29W222]|uniref:tRNA (Adenosine(37)-N6)-threonylcarbamoyltransferase complex dimerization subunit type 1 TsaB n=1 Tax=Fulvivirga marina TaxID=2494733 RepID=A0A937FWL2_9BACT|nr:tRNA (adenosine(37)-N6)-threonylcarbamoyltransferase complex dimerization subunit type 1 TsaB [Fulvivirga marina]MBL6446368.1 tRNA (adenosine(37)-N6)-threonylcarbamoyltransferase complex dimerization subunit type 1 TsaB [Fulvivirga marina]